METPMDWIGIGNMIAIAGAAASGALLAAEKEFDVVGAIFLAVAVGLGGGTLVDLLIGATPVRWLTNPYALPIAAFTGGVVFYTAGYVAKITRALDWLDAFSLALFTAAGLNYVLQHIQNPLSAGMLAILGACGGGMIRDVLASRPPMVFSGELYVTAVAAGVYVYFIVAVADLPAIVPFAICAGVTLALRAAAMLFRLRLSQPPALNAPSDADDRRPN
jgi:uncharacterized membrane protein YeiH